jgi:class 3 adenylate cyclase
MNETTSIQPRQRTIVAWDVEESTTRTNMGRAALRTDMYQLVEAALLECGISKDLREPCHDRGDGGVILVRPVDRAPKTLLLRTFVPVLSDMLAEHANTFPDRGFRLRVAIHSGEVLFDDNGIFGEDVDITFRLLNAPELKRRLRGTAAPLVLAVSDHIYRSVIRHGYDGIDLRTFAPIIELVLAGLPCRGWVQVPAEALASQVLPRIDRVS